MSTKKYTDAELRSFIKTAIDKAVAPIKAQLTAAEEARRRAALAHEIPQSYDEFVERFEESQDLPCCNLETGIGMPCPFCAAADFTRYPVFDVVDGPHRVQTCVVCQRAGVFQFEWHRHASGFFQRRFYVLQVSGPAQPTWFEPRIGWVQ